MQLREHFDPGQMALLRAMAEGNEPKSDDFTDKDGRRWLVAQVEDGEALQFWDGNGDPVTIAACVLLEG